MILSVGIFCFILTLSIVTMSITPAKLDFTEDGTPFSALFNDIYHSRDGALEQSRHVFLHGNHLPQRWKKRHQFVIAETGFGIGLNFLTAWQAWRQDPERCERLHFYSCELHPFELQNLQRLHQLWPALAPLAQALQQQWPCLTPGLHRIHLDHGQVCLDLYLGDAVEAIAQCTARIDAILLDGFAPDRNESIWSARLFHLLARHCASDATYATWCVAGAIRQKLQYAGFSCAKAPGFGAKRHMLQGSILRQPRSTPWLVAPPAEKKAIIVGAGLAGTSTAHRLAERGWTVDLIDAAHSSGQGASGNHAGVLRPLPNLDDNALARITRAGALYGIAHLRHLQQQNLPVRWEQCGALQLATDDTHEDIFLRTVRELGFPSDFLSYMDAAEASHMAGYPVTTGGWWLPTGAWVQPRSLCQAHITAWQQAIRCFFDTSVTDIRFDNGHWHVYDKNNHLLSAAPVLILANGTAITQIPQAASLPVRSARGQLTHLPAQADTPPRIVVCRAGYISPAVDGIRCVGATFTTDDDDIEPRLSDQQQNLATLHTILPGYPLPEDPSALSARVGFRPASPDRLPMVGPVPDTAALAHLNTPVTQSPALPGLYAITGFGARGLAWGALIAEYLASMINAEPLPLEEALCAKLDPARFLLRRHNHQYNQEK